jgi:hypothetical protein
LSDISSNISAVHAISSNIESAVIGLQPTDYNSNHAVLTGNNTQLKAAYTDTKNITAALKNM